MLNRRKKWIKKFIFQLAYSFFKPLQFNVRKKYDLVI